MLTVYQFAEVFIICKQKGIALICRIEDSIIKDSW